MVACETRTSPTSFSGAAAVAEESQPTASFLSYCSSCHLLPQPEDLPRGVWDTIVLPRMAHFLGRFAPGEREAMLANDPAGRQRLLAANVYPETPLCSNVDWEAIKHYYLSQAPKSLSSPPLPDRTIITSFVPRFPKVFLSPPSSSFIKILDGGGLICADINKEKLLVFDKSLEAVREIDVGKGLTGFMGNFATVIGSFSPTDAATGQLIGVTPYESILLRDSLQRPTSLIGLNLDDDPQQELIITEYGKWTGRLSRWDRVEGGFSDTTLVNRPGAITSVIDISATVPTIYVLYGQGREEIVRYRFPAGGVTTEVVQTFPPSYGSSSLQVIDWNKDTFPDLLYTNGDNADYASSPKPYHGIRIFTGNDKGGFNEELFLPLPGAYGAEVQDFDQDGDPDIAAISFFPDYTKEHPASAIFFQNEGVKGFVHFRLPAENKGRFIRITSGDYDLDGDIDLAAASLAMEAVPDNGRMRQLLQNGLPFIVWENKLK